MPGKKCLAVFLLYFLVDLSCEMDRQSPQIIWIELPGVIALVLSVLQWSLFRNRIDMIVLVVASAVVLTLQTHQRRQNQSYRSEEHTSELQSRFDLVCRLLLEKKKKETLAD